MEQISLHQQAKMFEELDLQNLTRLLPRTVYYVYMLLCMCTRLVLLISITLLPMARNTPRALLLAVMFCI